MYRAQGHWLNVVLLSVGLATLAGGCPFVLSTSSNQNAATQPDVEAEGDPQEIQQSLQNVAPTADAGSDATYGPGDRVVLDGLDSTDSDGDALTFEWVQIAGSPEVELLPTPFGSLAAFDVPSDLAAEVTLTFRLTVRDGFASDTDDVRVTVQP